MNTNRPAIPATFLAAAVLSMAFAIPAKAQALTILHAKVRVGSSICYATHTHTGYARMNGSKRTVARAAVRNWSSFTELEYGKAWSNLRRAKDRQISCSRKGASWSCEVTARPCRRG